MQLEEMSAFFEKRIDGYDTHMLEEVPGCKQGYSLLASLLPADIETLLDLGCGTGLELGPIFARFPDLAVTGVDLSQAMLERLREKYPGRNLSLVCGSYLDRSFGNDAFDAAVSFQTMHHIGLEEKARVYTAIRNALKPGGLYVECDYVVMTREEEESLTAQSVRLRQEQNVPAGELCHFDTPLCIENQLLAFQRAGFETAEFVWREGNTTIFIAAKSR
ncbi:MAG TPA: class I SAM-dependent methyltransferase [Clostridia bacterium]|nr:class I SAM-dependent methyltransferase [Clostridia bacterium]